MGRRLSGEAKITAQNLSESLKKILNKYGDDIKEVVRASVKKSGEYARKELKKVSPKDKTRPTESKRYAEGWKASDYTWTSLGAEITIHNDTKPGLAHLLEKGHLMRNGQRSKKYIHIEPVREEVEKEFEKTVKEAIERV